MLYYDRIGIPEGIDFNKTNASKECDISHYWYFLKKNLSFNQMSAIDAMMSMNLSNIYFLNIKNIDYLCIINGISKSEAIKLLQNIDLAEKSRTLIKKENGKL